ncbi:hypothetical protein FB451DRAFT_507101 [Mycena latifolia]|nr:hypothetical protein FB451DRAFT_507101 [Mycena latifolia]
MCFYMLTAQGHTPALAAGTRHDAGTCLPALSTSILARRRWARLRKKPRGTESTRTRWCSTTGAGLRGGQRASIGHLAAATVRHRVGMLFCPRARRYGTQRMAPAAHDHTLRHATPYYSRSHMRTTRWCTRPSAVCVVPQGVFFRGGFKCAATNKFVRGLPPIMRHLTVIARLQETCRLRVGHLPGASLPFPVFVNNSKPWSTF